MSAYKPLLRLALPAAACLFLQTARAEIPENGGSGTASSARAAAVQPAGEDTALLSVIDRTNKIFTLLNGELALHKNQPDTALYTYMRILHDTGDSAVAERAMEMAVGMSAYAEAESIYRHWQQIEPVPGPAQRRLAFIRSLIAGDFETAAAGFDQTAGEAATEEQQRRLYLLLIQTALHHNKTDNTLAEKIHRAAMSAQPPSQEALAASVVHNAAAKRTGSVLEALDKLAAADPEAGKATQLTLGLLNRDHPDILDRFFQKHAETLPSGWQEIRIERLVSAGRHEEAEALLEKQLAAAPGADLYILASYFAHQKHRPAAETVGLLEKAYQTGTQEQQSRAVAFAVIRLAEKNDFAAAKQWLEKIRSPEYAYEKGILQANLYLAENRPEQAVAVIRTLKKMPVKHSIMFAPADFFRLELSAVAQYRDPAKALTELDRLYRDTERTAAPDTPERNERLADILYRRGILLADRLHRPQQAVEDLQQALALRPDDPSLQNALGYSMLSLPQPDLSHAAALIAAAYSRQPDSYAVQDSLGWVHFLQGNHKTALSLLESAYQASPEAEIAAHLAEVLWQQNHRDRARTLLEHHAADPKLDVYGRKILTDTAKRLGITLKFPAKAAPKKKP